MIDGEGILEMMPDGYSFTFIRLQILTSPYDICVSFSNQAFWSRPAILSKDYQTAKEGEKYFTLH